MPYKGEDLDLRVPQGRQPGPPKLARAAPEGEPQHHAWPRTLGENAGEPLWVDEALLACCNNAFDLALAHGAEEVGLEHLVMALTRVDAGARALAAHGVLQAPLRRDVMDLIGGAAPIAHAERHSPRRSVELEDVLRHAVDAAARRAAAASIDDALRALLDSRSEHGAVVLLRRYTADRPTRDLRASNGNSRLESPHSDHGLARRIDGIETGLEAIGSELAGDRRILADLIRDLQRDVVAQRREGAALRSDLAARIEARETRLDASHAGPLGDRMQALERAVHSGLGEGARNWAALGQQMKSFEATLTQHGDPGSALTSGDLLETLNNRIAVMERFIQSNAAESDRRWSALLDRIGEASSLAAAATPDGGAFGERVAGLERAVRAGFGESAQTATLMSERMFALEKGLAARPIEEDAALMLDERLLSLERLIEAHVRDNGAFQAQLTERLKVVEERAGGAHTSLNAEGARQLRAAAEQAMSGFADRLGALDERLQATATTLADARRESAREVDDLQDALIRLGENQQALASSVRDWRHEGRGDMAAIGTQLEALASARTSPAPRPSQTPPPMPPAAAAPRPSSARDLPLVFAETPVRRTAPASETPSKPTASDDASIEIRRVRTGQTDDPFVRFSPSGETAFAPRGRGFRWWLFGTDRVLRANRGAGLKLDRMRGPFKGKP